MRTPLSAVLATAKVMGMTAPALREVEVASPTPRGRRTPLRILPAAGARPSVVPAPVHRPRLVDVIGAPGAPSVTVLVAPAGCGKTALLHDWAHHDERRFAWVALGREHDEEGRLAAAVAGALGQGAHAPGVLVLDDVHVLERPAALDALRSLARELAPGTRLVLASRTEPPLPVARMRLERRVLELGPRELAMTRPEAAALLEAAGHELAPGDLDALLDRTEGWPAGLALAALALAESGGLAGARWFGGSDRRVVEYVRDEMLAPLPAAALELLLRTSVADTLTAPLCDALLQRTGSEATLEALARAGHVIALDRTQERYRHHRLQAGALRAELRRRDPGLVGALHRRASDFYRRAGDVDAAIDHALLADDLGAAGALVWASVGPAIGAGRSAAVERWLGRFTEEQLAAEPRLALAAAGCELARGQGHLAEHRLAQASPRAGAPPSVQAGVAIMRAALGDDSLAGMEERVAGACDRRPGTGPWQGLAGLVGGTGRLLAGDRDGAAVQLHRGARHAAVTAPHLHALCLAQLGVLAFDEGDREEAAELVTRARAQVHRHALAGYATTALVFAASAVVHAHRGRIEIAEHDLREAVALQAELTHFPPSYEAQVALLLARAALRLGDLPHARRQLATSARLLRRVPDATVLHGWATAARVQLDACTAPDGTPPAAMTVAELRVLAFLPTHLSFREIADRIHVSANTIKTQANAVYRKLGVTCRSQAVDRARCCGLLDA